MSTDSTPVRIVAVGDGAIGKTCMLLVFKGDPFPEDYEPTIFESHHEMRQFQGKTYCLHLWDTAGQEEYDRLRPMSYSKCDVVLVCFALNDPDTLKNVTDKWYAEIKEFSPNAAKILVGTKLDLWDKTKIPQTEIDRIAKEIGAYKSILCSAKNNSNITNVFDLAIEAVVSKNQGGCRLA